MKFVHIFLIIFILINVPFFIFGLMNPVFIVPFAFLFFVWYLANKEYKQTSYYKITHYPLRMTYLNKGYYGEYLIYKYLEKQEANGAKFLFNLYVPKKNGETSEIDVIMIHRKGIFVFESKNYSGWIFGNEYQRIWTQTLPKGRGRSRKETFYNPIMQNKTHIEILEAFLGKKISTKSVIVFSERCTFKNVQVNSDDLYVIKRNQVVHIVNEICSSVQEEILSIEEILDIYNRLYPLTQADEETKKQHINNMCRNRNVQEEKNSVEEEKSSDDEQAIVTTELMKEVEVVNESEEENLVCPRCGGTLVLRTVKKGANIGRQFYGCSNYPKCRYVRNIK